jgi:hypothetical protein
MGKSSCLIIERRAILSAKANLAIPLGRVDILMMRKVFVMVVPRWLVEILEKFLHDSCLIFLAPYHPFRSTMALLEAYMHHKGHFNQNDS